jgi:hypothetical protein
MALPKKGQKKEVLQEIVEPVVAEEVQPEPEFLQEIKEPVHEEVLEEEPKKKGRKKTFGII